MSNSSGKFLINIREEKNEIINGIKVCLKINENLYIADENNDIIIFDIKSKKKILSINFHNKSITSIHICKKPLFLEKKELTFTENSFFILSSSLDHKFALHNIFYNNGSLNHKLIAQCKPTNDEINGIIQIENGQIVVATRDQSFLVYSNNITEGKFIKLYDIHKPWPMEARSLFEIKNNLIGICWEYDDAEADLSYDEPTFELNHSNDGLAIYLIDNKIKEKKVLSRILISRKNAFILLEDKFILNYYTPQFAFELNIKGIGVYNLNNLEFMFKFTYDYFKLNLCPFNKKYFVLLYRESHEKNKEKINIYDSNTLKNIQSIEIEIDTNPYKNCLFPISTNEYFFNNYIINIQEKK